MKFNFSEHTQNLFWDFLLLLNFGLIYLFIFLIYWSGDQMGLPRPPAFLEPSLTEDTMLEQGVNYASGGGGILNETGGLFVSI